MIKELKKETEELLAEKVTSVKVTDGRYEHMRYPRIVPLMDFYVDQYELNGFGHLMVMHTKTKMGMELLTMSFMPDDILLPYLLIDAMEMKKKRCVFVEYYGCGQEGLCEDRLFAVHEKYHSLPEYDEKPGWYISERRPYSLIKSGTEEELLSMAKDSVSAYLSSIKEAGHSPEYREKLIAFRRRMITEGNPSSKTLEMLLKKDGAVSFMKEVVMPIRLENIL